MKSIRKKIFVLVALPFLVIYTALSAFIVYQVSKYISIYASLSQRDVWYALVPVLLPIGTSLLISLVIIAMLFFYLSKGIVVPLTKLTRASEDIVAGNLDARIDIVRSSDEMGMISKSLSLMAEQFKTSKFLQKQSQDRFNVILQIHNALFRSASLGETFTAVLDRISEYFGVFKSTLVLVLKEEVKIVALYPAEERDQGGSHFFAHSHVVKLLEGKKHLTMNGGTLEAAQLSFLNYSTRSLCILPLRMEEVLRGYIIMEGKKPETLVHDDTTLLFLGDALSYLLSFRVDWEREITKTSKQPDTVSAEQTDGEEFITEDDNTFLEKVKKIQNLDAEKGILLIGGEKKKYTELLKITIKVVSDEILKMRSFYTKNLAAFGIEVHGIKAALYTIGAEALGDEARQLEFAAKSNDAVYCKENYPLFEEKLRILSRNLAALFPKRERSFQKGVVAELETNLVKAQTACENFDIAAVTSLLDPLASLKWDNETIQENLQSILVDMENLEYYEMAGKIEFLLEIIRNTNP